MEYWNIGEKINPSNPVFQYSSTPMKYSSILFDLDGTLVKTISLYERAVIETMLFFGATLTTERFAEIYRMSDSIGHWMQEFGIDAQRKQEVRKKRDVLYMDLLRANVHWYPGAEDMLKNLSRDRKLGLVTGSWKTYVDAIEERLPVQKHFKTVITADDMGDFHKPHPHSLLLASDRLGVDPKTSIYVGDQLFDIHAAKAAGMESAVVLTEYTPKEAAEEADYVLTHITDLLKITK